MKSQHEILGQVHQEIFSDKIYKQWEVKYL